MNKKRNLFYVTIILLVAFGVGFVRANAMTTDDENAAEVRRVVEQSFQQLRAGDYNSLYDLLPSASQKRISRERFINSLQRTRGLYELDRLQINSVHTTGNLAMIDTTIFGRVRQTANIEGKIVARQYLVRENGSWRVTAGDRTSVQPLLAANPNFARRYPPREPHVLIKQNGRWIDARAMMRNAKRK